MKCILLSGFVLTGFANHAIASPHIAKGNTEKKAQSNVSETMQNIRTLSPAKPKVSETVTAVSQLSSWTKLITQLNSGNDYSALAKCVNNSVHVLK